jgi:mannose-6-phosphate isomerase-like protein (cupin superfamily)
MGDYTQVNLKEVEDQAKSFGMDQMEGRFPHGELGAGVSYQKLDPNFRLPFGHQHEEAEEVYVVLAGSGRMKLDDDIIDLKQWDVVRVSPPVMRGVEAGPDGLELLATNAGPNKKDTEPVPGWWSD